MRCRAGWYRCFGGCAVLGVLPTPDCFYTRAATTGRYSPRPNNGAIPPEIEDVLKSAAQLVLHGLLGAPRR